MASVHYIGGQLLLRVRAGKEPSALGASLTAGVPHQEPRRGHMSHKAGTLPARRRCVSKVADALYAPGLGAEVGSNPYGYRDVFQGLFMAPRTVGEALCGASFASAFFQAMGLRLTRCRWTAAGYRSSRNSGVAGKLRALARAIQGGFARRLVRGSRTVGYAGYEHQVHGRRLLRARVIYRAIVRRAVHPTYTAYLHGGLSREHVILACLRPKKRFCHIGADAIMSNHYRNRYLKLA